MKTSRMGSKIFRLLDKPVQAYQSNIRDGFDIQSESGKITHVVGVQSARSTEGKTLMIAPNGAIIDHPEHGKLPLEPGTYEVDQVREARPEEERARTLRFEPPQVAPTSLSREQLD